MPKKLNEKRQNRSIQVIIEAIEKGKHSEWVTDGWISPKDLSYAKEYLTKQGFFVEYREEYPFPKLYWDDFSLKLSEINMQKTEIEQKKTFWTKIKSFLGISILFLSFNSCTNTKCVKSHSEQYEVLEYDYITSENFEWKTYSVEICDEHIITNLPAEKNKDNTVKVYNYK